MRRVGVMCTNKIDLTRRWSVQRSGDCDVTDVSSATDGIVNQMPLHSFDLGLHPCCLALICLTEQCVGDGEVVLSIETS